ncbi:ABC transporter ATP-binding protein [bacterium]|nr:MAG: ABC transporter ATP-binding protein [bacterium]
MATSPSNVISAAGITKVYGHGKAASYALRGVDLEVRQGESLAIVGKSGSGKSTLMHVLALLDTPTSGTVTIDGSDSTNISDARRDAIRNREFGFVFQQFFLNPRQSLLDNVTLPLMIGGEGRSERNQRGTEVLQMVELGERIHSKAKELSGGQKQRVAIARALANRPKVLFADEPTGNLDSATGEMVQDILFRLNKEEGITIIVVTHDEDLAKRCERFIEIKDGQIVAEGRK